MEDYFKYRFGDDISFNLNSGDFISIIGNTNDLFVFFIYISFRRLIIFFFSTPTNLIIYSYFY